MCKDNDGDKRQTNNDCSADYDAWALTRGTYDERCEEENVYPRSTVYFTTNNDMTTLHDWLLYENAELAFFAALLGAILSTVATIPQAWKASRGSTKDLHLGTFATHLVSALVWALYGFLTKAWILFLECIVVSILNFYVCLCILRDKCYPTRSLAL
jgi:uncharacterized protein with PQ loop repeat